MGLAILGGENDEPYDSRATHIKSGERVHFFRFSSSISSLFIMWVSSFPLCSHEIPIYSLANILVMWLSSHHNNPSPINYALVDDLHIFWTIAWGCLRGMGMIQQLAASWVWGNLLRLVRSPKWCSKGVKSAKNSRRSYELKTKQCQGILKNNPT